MAKIETLFATQLYRTDLGNTVARDLEHACRSIAEEDTAGRAWCRKNGYVGYTSYASLNDLPWRAPEFAALAKKLDRHVRSFALRLDLDLAGGALELDSLWINVMPYRAHHTGHIHPQSVVSGTFYVRMPDGAAAIKFEDPRLPYMMAAPARRTKARRANRQFIYITPKVGTLLLWESWLRHEVPLNQAKSDRISISFNYRWAHSPRS